MKHLSILAVAFMLGIAAFADDFNLYYVATTSADNNKIESVANLQKLTFQDGTMVVTRKDGTTSTISIADIQRLFFSTDATVAIEDVKAEGTGDKENEVYDLTGRKLNIDPTQQQLPKGIYIMNGKKVLAK